MNKTLILFLRTCANACAIFSFIYMLIGIYQAFWQNDPKSIFNIIAIVLILIACGIDKYLKGRGIDE